MPDRQTTPGRVTASDPAPDGRPARTRRRDPGTKTDGAPRDGRDPRPEGAAGPVDEPEPLFGWPPRDFIAPFVLLAVSMQRSHGYVIEDYLRALGLFGITMSTLYRTLRQMEKDGFLESTWEPGPTGPARRVYTITDAGHVWLDSSALMLNAYRETIDRFFGLYGAGPRANRARRADSKAEKETPL